jgi:hypothetical protein
LCHFSKAAKAKLMKEADLETKLKKEAADLAAKEAELAKIEAKKISEKALLEYGQLLEDFNAKTVATRKVNKGKRFAVGEQVECFVVGGTPHSLVGGGSGGNGEGASAAGAGSSYTGEPLSYPAWHHATVVAVDHHDPAWPSWKRVPYQVKNRVAREKGWRCWLVGCLLG